MDVLAVADAARRAALPVRAGGGPVFLELRTYRFRAHSMYDPQLYRSKDEVEHWKQRDPILLYGERLVAAGLLDADERERLEREIASEIDDATAFAEAGHLEPVEQLERFVYSDPPPRSP